MATVTGPVSVDMSRVFELTALLQRTSKHAGYDEIEWSAALFLLVGFGLNAIPRDRSMSTEEIGKHLEQVWQKIGLALSSESKVQ